MRNTSITIVKAIAIILVVMAHSGAPTWLSSFCYMLCVSLFFVASGYCFKASYLNNEIRFVQRRFRRLYVPFVTWSVFFLLLNPLLFQIGFLNEQYGNAAGGVTHPLDLHQGLQAFWSIIFNMSGYDQFLCGAYWFFRAMLVASIFFLFALKLANSSRYLRQFHLLPAVAVGLVALIFAFWQHSDGLRVTGLAQGGYREFMAIFFISVGFIYKSIYTQFIEGKCDDNKTHSDALPLWLHLTCLPLSGAALVFILGITHPSMSPSASSFLSIIMLALSGMIGFCFIYSLSVLLGRVRPLRKVLSFIGDNTIYILGFHLLAFKVVSMIKVGVYHLPWNMVGGHPVVNNPEGSWFWILYTIVGIVLPLAVVWCIRYCAEHYDIHSYARLARFVGRKIWSCLCVIGTWLVSGSVWIATNGWQGICRGFRTIWEGIYYFCVRFVDTVKAGADVRDDHDDDDSDEEYNDDEYEYEEEDDEEVEDDNDDEK